LAANFSGQRAHSVSQSYSHHPIPGWAYRLDSTLFSLMKW